MINDQIPESNNHNPLSKISDNDDKWYAEG